jgi:hypothetical protein
MMTILVLNTDSGRVATPDWTAREHAPEVTEIRSSCLFGFERVSIGFDEFLEVIRNGGKLLDLRRFQEKA